MATTTASAAEFQNGGKPVAQPVYLVDVNGNPISSTNSQVVSAVQSGPWTIQQSLTNKGVAAGAGTVVIKGAPGWLTTVVITVAGTVSLQIFDNASAGSGLLLLTSPATTTIGQVFNIFGAAILGMTALGAAGTPGFTVYYS
jgi:hypothetical protein